MKKIKISLLVLASILVLIAPQLGDAELLSQYALIQRRIFADPDVWHLTKAYANSEWGVDLYAYPTSVSMVYFTDSSGYAHSVMSFTSDYAFHRIVYSEAYSDWIRTYGSFGSSIGQFNSPSGIVAFNRSDGDSENHHIYVADTWNNRICGFTYDWSSEVINSPYEITGGGLVLPKDLDINNGGEFGDPNNDRLWVANGDNTIKKFDLNGNLLLTYAPPWGFDNLKAITCGRSYFTDPPPPYEHFANNNYIYAINQSSGSCYEIYQYEENPPGNIQYVRSLVQRIAQSPGSPPRSIDVSSLDIDNVGQVWLTVDFYEGENRYSYIQKFTDDLEVLCTFDAGGSFHRLQCFSDAGGKWGCGNAIVLEDWDIESGALYYWIATDILSYTTGSNPEHWCHYAAYILVDPALISVKVYNEAGGLIRTVKDTIPHVLNFSGWEDYSWDGYNNSGQIAPSGNYRIQVTAYSAYINVGTGQPVNIVSKDGWVYHIDYSQPLLVPTITSVQAVDTSMYIEWDDNNNNELGYIIERKDITNNQWTVLDTTTWNIESYTDHHQIVGSETYYYRIKAYNYFSSSGYSNIVSKKARPYPPKVLYVENWYCNRPVRPAKVTPSEGGILTFKSPDKFDCYPPYPDSILSDLSVIYVDYPTNQKPGTYAKMGARTKSCHWYNHNCVSPETIVVNLQYHRILIHTPPDTVYCTGDWTYYFQVRTHDIYGDTSIWLPQPWGWPYACCVGPCHIPIEPTEDMLKLEIPIAFSLEQNYPNPFNPETQIRYALPQASPVKLVLYNILGQKVRTLIDGYQTAGYKTVHWDGKDENGEEVASGIYFYRLLASEYNEVKKMVIVK